MTGGWHMTGHAWPELAAPSPLQGSVLADWKQGAIDAKLLDDR